MKRETDTLAKHSPGEDAEASTDPVQQVGHRGIMLCVLAYIIFILLSMAPLTRLAGTDYFRNLAISGLVTMPGGWLPSDLHLTAAVTASRISTNVLLFLLLTALMFIAYGIAAWLIDHAIEHDTFKGVMRLIWIGTVVGGLLFVFCPAMLSHDIFVYAGYGRLLAAHHVNPYFTTPSAFPADPITPLDDWRNAPAAYGPLWILICTAIALPAGVDPLSYVLIYRLLALTAHLVNTLLVASILRTTRASSRTIALGTLLYAWNPLALEESCLGGHNDIIMVTCMLLGVYSWSRVARDTSVATPRLRQFVPALLAFTLALLIKFTAIPLLILFLVLLVRSAMYPTTGMQKIEQSKAGLWRRMISVVLSAGLLCAAIVLAFYLPFWPGHSISAIISSFTSPPSANSAYGSILAAIQAWLHASAPPSAEPFHTLLMLLTQQKAWSAINVISLLLALLSGALWIWRTPTIRTLLLASLAALGTLLIVTPWFFPWYVTWLLGLAAPCLPTGHQRLARALVGAALAFSASAFCIYLFFHNVPPLGGWIGFTFLTTIGPPFLTLVVVLLFPSTKKTFAEPAR